MKLAFIVQRYGREILGGAETLARQIAERLARRHDIDVLTTTARDYITWRNAYPAGEEKLRGVRIKRFPVEGERDLEEFNRFSDWIYKNDHSREDELKWLEMQGPVAPGLIEHLRKEHRRYELLVFFTYLYYPTYYGLRIAPEKSALLPTAHDEPPLALEIYKEVFGLPSSLIFNTEAEELLVLERFGSYKKMRETIGIGMDLLDQPDATAFRRRHKLLGRYLLYAGRIDAGKGCEELLRYFRFYKEERPGAGNLQLVLIGKQSMRLPNARDIRYLGFLDEDEKLAAMAGSMAVVVPSRLESLSIVALEAFSVGSPVIAHADSRVLVDHCRKSNAGLYYSDYEEFEQILDLMLTDKNLARGMGRLAQMYIKDHFGWEKLLNRYELAFRASARRPRPTQRDADDLDERSHSQLETKTLPAERPEVGEPTAAAVKEGREAESVSETIATDETPATDDVAEPKESAPIEPPDQVESKAPPKAESTEAQDGSLDARAPQAELRVGESETSVAPTIREPAPKEPEVVPDDVPKDVENHSVKESSTDEATSTLDERRTVGEPAAKAPAEETPVDKVPTEELRMDEQRSEESATSEDSDKPNQLAESQTIERKIPERLETLETHEDLDSESATRTYGDEDEEGSKRGEGTDEDGPTGQSST